MVEIALDPDERKMFDHSVNAVRDLIGAVKRVEPSLSK